MRRRMQERYMSEREGPPPQITEELMKEILQEGCRVKPHDKLFNMRIAFVGKTLEELEKLGLSTDEALMQVREFIKEHPEKLKEWGIIKEREGPPPQIPEELMKKILQEGYKPKRGDKLFNLRITIVGKTLEELKSLGLDPDEEQRQIMEFIKEHPEKLKEWGIES